MGRERKYNLKPGDRFGRLTVIREVQDRNGARMILCKCECGNVKEINLNSLVSGRAKSCGCMEHVKRAKVTLTHAGRTMTISEWAKETGMSPATIRTRMHLGWTPERIFTEEVEHKKSYIWRQRQLLSTASSL